MLRYTCIAAAVLVPITCLPFLTAAKWIGHFTLTVDLDVAPEIDVSSITYIEVWDRDVANWLCNARPEDVTGFERPAMATADSHSVTVTCSGDSGAFGMLDTYRHPEFLVAQYRAVDAPTDSFARKIVEIPAGRGPRRTTLALP